MRIMRLFVGFALLLTALTACAGQTSTVPPSSTSRVGGSNGTPTDVPVTSPGATSQASPSAAPGSTALTLGDERATSVSVPDASGPARYATTIDSLYQSTDGETWNQVGRWDPAFTLLVDSTNPSVLYSGGHPGCSVGGPAVSLQKSTDGGNTWETLLTGQNVRPMIVDPANPKVVYGERCSLAISVDGGQSWTDYAMTPSFDVTDMALVGHELYVLITSEGGTSRIRPIDVSDPSQPKMGADLHEFWGGGTVDVSSGRIIVGEPHGVDVSSDGGQSWTFSRTGLESVTVSVNALAQPIPKDEISRKFGIYSLAVDPGDASHIFAGTVRGLYQSADGGKTWSRVPQVDEIPVNDLTFGRNGAILYLTTDNGVFILQNP